MRTTVVKYIFGMSKASAKLFYVLHQIASKFNAPQRLLQRLRRSIGGVVSYDGITIELRPGTLDSLISHPEHESETHSWIYSASLSGAMIDVGAYNGCFSLKHLYTFEKIYGFEANSHNFSAFTKNIELSGAATRIVPINAAVGEKDGVLPLYLSNEDTHSLIPVEGADCEEVRAVTLDSWLMKIPERVALLKIDVEGAEIGVIKGGMQLIKKHRPYILLEANTPVALTLAKEVLANIGYSQKDGAYDGRNYLFSPVITLK